MNHIGECRKSASLASILPETPLLEKQTNRNCFSESPLSCIVYGAYGPIPWVSVDRYLRLLYKPAFGSYRAKQQSQVFLLQVFKKKKRKKKPFLSFAGTWRELARRAVANRVVVVMHNVVTCSEQIVHFTIISEFHLDMKMKNNHQIELKEQTSRAPVERIILLNQLKL